MKTIELHTIQVKQPIGLFYVTKISYSDLLAMSKVDIRHITEDDEILGIQRELKGEKVNQIQKYLTTVFATFPNSIIVNINSADIVSSTESSLTINANDDTFTIIDGQHRLAGFEDYKGGDFELVLSIFVDLDTPQQAEIFTTINSEQTKVDPSLNVNLELDSKFYTPRKMMVEISQSFNLAKDSPWYNGIKMLGGGNEGMISLASFARPLFGLTYRESDWYIIKNRLMTCGLEQPNFDDFNYDISKYIFWEFYKNHDSASVYKILNNYFSAFQSIFQSDWMNEKSILNKTTGYNAMMRLFKDLIPLGFREKRLTYDFFANVLSPLAKLDGTINAKTYGSSGLYSTNQLYKDFVDTLDKIIV